MTETSAPPSRRRGRNAPQAGVTFETRQTGPNHVFTLRNGDSWLRGWLVGSAKNATVSFEDGVLSITRTGTAAEFQVVLALGRGEEPADIQTEGDVVTVAGTTIDLAHLADHHPE